MDAAKTRLKKAKAAETRASVSSVFLIKNEKFRLITFKLEEYVTNIPHKLQYVIKSRI